MYENILTIIQELKPKLKIAFLFETQEELNNVIEYFKQHYKIYDFWDKPKEECLSNNIVVIASDLKSKTILNPTREKLPELRRELISQTNEWFLHCYDKNIVLFSVGIKPLYDKIPLQIRGGASMYDKFWTIYSISKNKIREV